MRTPTGRNVDQRIVALEINNILSNQWSLVPIEIVIVIEDRKRKSVHSKIVAERSKRQIPNEQDSHQRKKPDFILDGHRNRPGLIYNTSTTVSSREGKQVYDGVALPPQLARTGSPSGETNLTSPLQMIVQNDAQSAPVRADI